MSHQAAPKQILQKKQISRKEYNFREEWAPETVNEYQVSHDECAKHQHQHQHQSEPPPQPSPNPTPHPNLRPQPQSQFQHQPVYSESTGIQPRVPNKRTQARSSSLFEEWKAKALRSPDGEKEKAKEDAVSPTTSTAPKVKMSRGRGKSGKGTVSGDVRVLLGEHSDSTVNIRAKNKGPGSGVVEAAVQKEGNKQVEEHVIPVDATGPQEEHASKASNAQVRTEEPGSCPVTLSRGTHRKNMNRSKNLYAEGPTEKRPNEAERKGTTETPDAGSEAATKDNNKREESTARDRARSKEPTIASPALPETIAKSKGGAASTSIRGISRDRTVTLRSTAEPAANEHGQQSEAGRTGHAAVTSAGGPPKDKTATLRSTAKPATNNHGSELEAGKTDDAKEENQPSAPSSNNAAASLLCPETVTKGSFDKRGRGNKTGRQQCDWEWQDARGRQRSLERQELYRGRSLDRKPYTAPNGTLLGADELRKLALGTTLKGTDKVYFIPCFIEDPWKDLTPIPSICPPDLMSRF